MNKTGEKALLIALGMPHSEEKEDEVSSKEAEEAAVEEMFSALESKDKSAFGEALKAFLVACEGSYEESESED